MPSSVFLLDPDDPGGTGKPGGVISGCGRQKSPAGCRVRASGGVRGAKPPEMGVCGRSSQKLNRF